MWFRLISDSGLVFCFGRPQSAGKNRKLFREGASIIVNCDYRANWEQEMVGDADGSKGREKGPAVVVGYVKADGACHNRQRKAGISKVICNKRVPQANVSNMVSQFWCLGPRIKQFVNGMVWLVDCALFYGDLFLDLRFIPCQVWERWIEGVVLTRELI